MGTESKQAEKLPSPSKRWMCFWILIQIALLVGIGFAFYYVLPTLFRLLVHYNSLGGQS